MMRNEDKDSIGDGDGGLDGDDYNPQHPACPLFSFGGVEGNSLDDAAAEMEQSIYKKGGRGEGEGWYISEKEGRKENETN